MSLVKHYVRINQLVGSMGLTASGVRNYRVTIDGKTLVETAPADTLLTELYKTHVGDYSKFYKMDPLCRVGFMASELLLTAEDCRQKQWGESRGVVLFNATSSLADDRNYQATIDDSETAFPSPSLFVYTLPNVLTGEIAIRNHYYSETNFVVLPEFDSNTMSAIIEMTFCDKYLQSLVTGWVDCYDETNYNVLMFIVERDVTGHSTELSQEIKILTEK
ncbi:MAG: hypothetical protein K5867_00185 [Bacteroidales bacterium]|nr:hypothetical protein [Bacteroidales bacterium]